VSAKELEAAKVVIEAPQEPQAVIEALIYGGEGPHEFKSCLPWQGQADSKRPFKTIAAFANGDGGTLVYGVDRDELTIIGLDDAQPASRDRLSQMICAQVIPKPQFSPAYHAVDGKTVLVVRVEPGNSPPYGLISDPGSRDKPEFYVRRGANTYHAYPPELRAAVLSRLPAAANQMLPPFLT
jgi:predicted HTH transcriptional regulator